MDGFNTEGKLAYECLVVRGDWVSETVCFQLLISASGHDLKVLR